MQIISMLLAAVLFDAPGNITATNGWEFKPSDSKDGMVYNPFEGTFPDKGGQLFSPSIKLNQKDGEGAYYRLTFTAEAEKKAFEGVCYFDKDGKELPDRYDVFYAGKASYDRIFYAMPGVDTIKLFFQSDKPFKTSDVKVENATVEEAAAFCDRAVKDVPPFKFTAPADAFKLLPKTKAALAEGTPWRVVMLGDSNSQDLYHSLYHALVKREFPKSDLRFMISMRGSTGIAYYGDPKHPEYFKEYVLDLKPDLLIIGGASNYRVSVDKEDMAAALAAKKEEFAAIKDGNKRRQAENKFKSEYKNEWVTERLGNVIRQAQAAGIEVLVCTPMPAMDTRLNPWTPTFNPDFEKDLGPMTFDAAKNFWCQQTYFPEQMKSITDKCGVEFWDFTTQAYTYLFESGKPYQWFGRDDYHSGERGKQVWGRLYLEFWKTAK